MTCHDPHRDAETSAAFYETKCLACHAASTTARNQARASEDAFRSTCPINASRNCVQCHMPKVWYADLRTYFTDHYIRVHTR